MRVQIIVIALVLGFQATVSARIGESKEQLDSRYGVCASDKLEGEERILVYAKGEYLFRFTLLNDKAVSMFIKKQENQSFESEEVANFLVKSVNGKGWQVLGENLKGSVWVSNDEKCNAFVNKAQTTILITVKGYSDYKEQKTRKDIQEKMSGF